MMAIIIYYRGKPTGTKRTRRFVLNPEVINPASDQYQTLKAAIQ
jgi:hypothetical protein